jgi:electron transport complex protein RnfC
VHPHEHKELTEARALEVLPTPAELYVPLGQHLGKPASPLVKKGTYVRQGQLLAESSGFISAPVHAPVGGTVKKMVKGPVVGGTSADMFLLVPGDPEPPKKKDDDAEEPPPVDTSPVLLPSLPLDTVTAEQIVERVKEVGIVGQGGAAFPTAVKLSPPPDKPIDWMIINGAECEPYLTRDYRLMLERADELVEGILLIGKALGEAVNLGIGIENNKPAAIAALREAVSRRGARIEIFELQTKYPQGGEKMLIDAALGRQVPPGALPMEVGCVIQNVGTALAIRDAVLQGDVPRHATLTVSGKGINEPKNLQVPIGTPLEAVIEFCGGINERARRIVVGGPMMGFAAYSLDAPVVKATSGILVLTEDEIPVDHESPCINCGKCIEACPVNLLPTRLVKLAKLKRWEEERDLGIEVCMECGTCAFTCPAHIPLVQYLRLAKRGVRSLPRKEG